MNKSKAPASPDYSALASSSLEAAKLQRMTSQEQLDWAKQQYADQLPITKEYLQSAMDTMTSDRDIAQQQLGLAKRGSEFYGEQVGLSRRVAEQQMSIAAENQANAQEAQNYYKSTYRPIESQFAETARGYASPDRAASEQARAEADVARTMGNQRTAALQSLEGYGIDPTQTRYGALDLGARIATAATQAATGTQSRRNTEATGLAMQGEAINVGRGYPGQVASAYGTAINAGQGAAGAGAGAIGAGSTASGMYGGAMASNAAGIAAGRSGIDSRLNTTSIYGNMLGNASQWGQLANQSMGLGMNAMNTGFQNQMAGFQANSTIDQNNMSGIGSLVGVAAAAGAVAI